MILLVFWWPSVANISSWFFPRFQCSWRFHFSIFRVPPELILAAGAWRPPQAHLAFVFLQKRKFCDPSLKNAVPPKKCRYLTPDPPPKKSEWSVLFSSSHIFVFFFNLSFVRNFCGYRKFDCTQVYANANFSKLKDLKNRGFKNLAHNVDKFSKSPIFEVCEFWKSASA